MVIDRLFCTHWRCASKKHICAKIIETKKFSALKFPGDFLGANSNTAITAPPLAADAGGVTACTRCIYRIALKERRPTRNLHVDLGGRHYRMTVRCLILAPSGHTLCSQPCSAFGGRVHPL
jgi:DNA-directed RNA polymerase subunit RPC12/RpoP